jgi:hypothetical protein
MKINLLLLLTQVAYPNLFGIKGFVVVVAINSSGPLQVLVIN